MNLFGKKSKPKYKFRDKTINGKLAVYLHGTLCAVVRQGVIFLTEMADGDKDMQKALADYINNKLMLHENQNKLYKGQQ